MDTSEPSGRPSAAASTSSLGIPGGYPESLIETQTSLNRAVWDRRAEYCHAKTIRVKVGTWNVAATQGTEKDLGGWFVHGKGVSEALSGLNLEENQDIEGIHEQESRSTPTQSTLPMNDPGVLPKDKDIGMYVLGLQEIVDVSSPVEAMRPYHDRAPSERWKSALLNALPKGYSLIAEQQLVGMYILIYAAYDVASNISNVSCRSVGTGLMGYMGNKGAVVVRLVIGETTRVVFINSHLSAGAEKANMDRRNWDAAQVLERTRFDALDHGHGVVDEVEETIGDEDFCFWFGDLNYRLADLPGDDIRRLLMLHTKEQYVKDKQKRNEQPSEIAESAAPQNGDETEIDPDQDPASMQATIASLLPHDELHDQIRKKAAFNDGWQEGKIRFMPTYKYDVGSVGMFDSSEKRRAPSWCDRILYRTRKHYEEHKKSMSVIQEDVKATTSEPTSGKLPTPASYEYDPDEDAEDPVSDEPGHGQSVTTKSGFEDNIELEYYTSHQRVLSSDHKPLNAVFQLTYQAVDPQKKAAVYQEVAKEFDRLENESRPSLTVAVDTAEGKSTDELIDFGAIRFDEAASRTVTIANTGRNSATFAFTNDTPWLHVSCDVTPEDSTSSQVSQSEYRIEPGDALTATVTAHVRSPADARALNSQPSTALEDVLVLRVSGGRDHFLTIRATWLKSCFGMSMAQLIRTPEDGIRNSETVSEATDVKCSAPRELFKLTEALEANLERAVAEWGMTGNQGKKTAPWDANGWPLDSTTWIWRERFRHQAIHNIHDALDTGRQLDADMQLDCAQKVEIFAEVLVHFLDSLHDGIVTKEAWSQIRNIVIDWEKAKRKPDDDAKRVQILEIISASTPHNVSFTLITVMVKRIVVEIAATAGHTEASKGDGVGVSADPKHELEKRKGLQAAYVQTLQRVMFRPYENEPLDKEGKKDAARKALILELFIEEGTIS